MRIAYLFNGHPPISHGFIRRATFPLKRLEGVEMRQVSVRRADQTLEAVDQGEANQTAILSDRPVGFLLNSLVYLP